MNMLDHSDFTNLSKNECEEINGGGILGWIILGGICIVVSAALGSCQGKQQAENEIKREYGNPTPTPSPTPTPYPRYI